MRAYTEELVRACHKRGAHAMGGMAAFIPSRKDPEINKRAFDKVREDKEREAHSAFDGSWIAHPDLLPVAREAFDKVLDGKPNQINRLRDDVKVSAADLLNFNIRGSQVTEEGLRENISVAIQYIHYWLKGVGASAINHLMEDAATAEISRSQLWNWLKHSVSIEKLGPFTRDLYQQMRDEELAKLEGAESFEAGAKVLDRLVLAEDFPSFLTTLAYQEIP